MSRDIRNCGACGHACTANHYCKAGACEPGCPDRVLYVSNAGNDLNSGCSQAAPRKTLTATIGLARSLGFQGHEIRICAGTYVQAALALDHPVSLRGGYDCASWTRTGGETILQRDEASPAGATLGIRGSAVAGVVVEGLTIRGGTSDQGGGAVLVSTGASPILRDDIIVGGASESRGDSLGSYGIYVQAGASPEVTACVVQGGSGSAQGSFGSVGIAIASDAGSPRVHDNRIEGGTGTTTVGIASAGLLFSGKAALTGERAVRNNEIHGGEGRVLAGSGSGSIGVLVNDAAAIDLIDNVIEAGTSTCAGACPVRGVSMSGTQGARLAGNRIDGGNAAKGTTAPRDATAWGVFIAESRDVLLENNTIHGGGKTNPMHTMFAVEVSSSSGVQLRGNTLTAAAPSAGGQSYALGITRQSSGAAIEDNRLEGARTASDVALLVFACPAGSTMSSFRSNVLANFGETLAYSVTTTSVACDTRGAITSVASLEQFVANTAGASSVGGNARSP